MGCVVITHLNVGQRIVSRPTFPPNVGDTVGFTVLGIDYDDGAVGLFGTNAGSFPWEGNGLEAMTFIEAPAQQ